MKILDKLFVSTVTKQRFDFAPSKLNKRKPKLYKELFKGLATTE